MICPSCQASNDADWAFCQQCGTRLQGAAPQSPSPQPPAWDAGSATVVTPPAPPQQGNSPGWSAPTVVTPAPGFGNQPPQQPPAPQPPPAGNQQSWGAPTVVTPVPNFNQPSYGNPPAGGPQGQPGPPGGQPSWGAPTVVTPAPSFGNQPPQQPPAPPPQPPAGNQQSWGAPTVVTPMPDMGQSFGAPQQPLEDDQRYVETVVGPLDADINAYPETVVGPMEIPPTNEMSAASSPATSAPPRQGSTAPTSGPKTADVSVPQTGAPAGDQRTIVMSSTPIAEPPKAGRLLLIMEGGEIGDTYNLRPSETVVGRVDGDIRFPHDGYMSSRHARIIQRNGRFFLLDNNSRNGTFIRIHQEVELHPGDVILVGKQLFRFESEE